MFSAIKNLFFPEPYQEEAHRLYTTLVNQSRAPVFYSQHHVPDTVDGRFDMIVLHVCLLCRCLQEMDSDEAIDLSRALMETFFADMDRSLREMGSTDTGVGKRIKNMSKAYFGRLQAYDDAFGNDEALKQALRRNLYRGGEVQDESLSYMVDYINQRMEQYASLSLESLKANSFTH